MHLAMTLIDENVSLTFLMILPTTVKLFDFGLARVLSESGDGNHDTYEMSGAGTPRSVKFVCIIMTIPNALRLIAFILQIHGT